MKNFPWMLSFESGAKLYVYNLNFDYTQGKAILSICGQTEDGEYFDDSFPITKEEEAIFRKALHDGTIELRRQKS